MTAGVLVFGLRGRRSLAGLMFAARRAEPEPDGDTHLICQAQAGDATAFSELVRHYEPRLRSLA